MPQRIASNCNLADVVFPDWRGPATNLICREKISEYAISSRKRFTGNLPIMIFLYIYVKKSRHFYKRFSLALRNKMLSFCVKNSSCRHSGESRNLDFPSRLDAGLRLSALRGLRSPGTELGD